MSVALIIQYLILEYSKFSAFLNFEIIFKIHYLKFYLAVTCMYEDVLVKAQHNIKPEFTITYANGTVETLTKLPPVTYPYLSIVRYFCQEGFQTVTKTSDQNLTCGPIGRWAPQLSACISKCHSYGGSKNILFDVIRVPDGYDIFN